MMATLVCYSSLMVYCGKPQTPQKDVATQREPHCRRRKETPLAEMHISMCLLLLLTAVVGRVSNAPYKTLCKSAIFKMSGRSIRSKCTFWNMVPLWSFTVSSQQHLHLHLNDWPESYWFCMLVCLCFSFWLPTLTVGISPKLLSL